MLKKLIVFLVLCVCFSGICQAQTVIAEGRGGDEEAARRDAMRSAVEKVLGVLVNSESIVENSVLIMDEILTNSQGYITGFEILNSRSLDGLCEIRARVDVDTEPDSALLQKLNMLHQSGNPRIAVHIQVQAAGSGQLVRDEIAENKLRASLLALGFTRVLDASAAGDVQTSSGSYYAEVQPADDSYADAELLGDGYGEANQMANDDYGYEDYAEEMTEPETVELNTPPTGSSSNQRDAMADILVTGNIEAHAEPISILAYDGEYKETKLVTGKATMTMRIVRNNTGMAEDVGTFDVVVVGNSEADALRKARSQVAAKAANELQQRVGKIVANPVNGHTITVKGEDATLVEQLVQEIKTLKGVNNAYFRQKTGKTTVLDVDAYQKVPELVRLLKARTKLNIYVENMSANTAEIIVIGGGADNG